jgi:hypothetical protein
MCGFMMVSEAFLDVFFLLKMGFQHSLLVFRLEFKRKNDPSHFLILIEWRQRMDRAEMTITYTENAKARMKHRAL